MTGYSGPMSWRCHGNQDHEAWLATAGDDGLLHAAAAGRGRRYLARRWTGGGRCHGGANAALELGRRLMDKEKKVLGVVTSSKEVYEWLRPQMQGLTKEIFKVLLLNGNNEILESVNASEGSLTESPVYLRDLVNLANRHRAAALIVAHNHPSGNPRPSTTDKSLTEELVLMGRLLKIGVLDHGVIGDGDR